MITYKKLCIGDIPLYWNFLIKLDHETQFMMYEPEERSAHTSIHELTMDIQTHVIDGHDFLLAAFDEERIVGYIRAECGVFHRNFHTAYIVTGILKAYSGKGIGTEFFRQLDEWANTERVRRLELTVECDNHAAKHLYEKCGFSIEGIRKGSMLVDGTLVDEYYMAKIVG